MIIGTRLVAPSGFGAMPNDCIYYFLRNNWESNKVILVCFVESASSTKTQIIALPRQDFEEALRAEKLKVVEGDHYPPWLKAVSPLSTQQLERKRKSAKKSYAERMDARYLAFAELVDKRSEILASGDSDSIINAYAKASRPEQNSGRLKLWFYSYLIFGRKALMPRFHLAGRWNREAKPYLNKFGRPSSKGRNFGCNITKEMKEKIKKAYVKFRSQTGSADEIYTKSVCDSFECVAIELPRRRRGVIRYRIIQPDNLPYPSPGQFWYWVRKLTDARVRAEELKGKRKARAESGYEGKFSDRVMNLNQRVEFDGYNITEKLEGVIEGSAVDGFCVVRAVCVMSGAIVGIGFAEGTENREAYRMALFSMAIDKVTFCSLFGLNIDPDEWPCIGLTDNILFDRGPGSSYQVDDEIEWLGTLTLPPSRSPQSKATVESSHPREKQNDDDLGAFHSDKNFVEMSKREIIQVLLDNAGSDARGRMLEEMYLAEVPATPNGIWGYMDDLFRNSGVGIPFDDAVRRFLSKHPATIQRDAVYLYNRRYRSPQFAQTGIFDDVARTGRVSVEVYVLVMCVRYIWIEYEGEMYQLDAIIPVAAAPGSAFISLGELKEIDQARKKAAREQEDIRLGAQMFYRNRLKDETGKDWDGGVYKKNGQTKDKAAVRDEADYKRFLGKK